MKGSFWGCVFDTSKRYPNDSRDDVSTIEPGYSLFKCFQVCSLCGLCTSSACACVGIGILCCANSYMSSFPIVFGIAWTSFSCSVCSFCMIESIQHLEPQCGQYLDKIGCHDSAKAYEEYRAQRVTQRVTMSE